MLTNKEKRALQEMLDLIVINENINKTAYEAPYIGTIESEYINADVYLDFKGKKARFYIDPKEIYFSNEMISEAYYFGLSYYNTRRHLLTVKRNKHVASFQTCFIAMNINREDVNYILLNIRQAILGIQCSKYKTNKKCCSGSNMEDCVYRIYKKPNEGNVLIGMSKKAVEIFFNLNMPNI